MRGAFQQSQAVLRAVLESPRDIVIFALDREYRYLAFNQNHATTIKAIWGVDIRIGSPMLEIIGRPDDRDKAKRNFDRALAGENFTVREEYGDERMQCVGSLRVRRASRKAGESHNAQTTPIPFYSSAKRTKLAIVGLNHRMSPSWSSSDDGEMRVTDARVRPSARDWMPAAPRPPPAADPSV